jgi:hypothetical protein
MSGRLGRTLGSQVVWFIGVCLCVGITARRWYEVVTEDHAPLTIVKAVLFTALTGCIITGFIVNRAWRNREDDVP